MEIERERVQSLLESGHLLSQIPSQYIQPLQDRPNPSSSSSSSSTSFVQIPVLDLSATTDSISNDLRSICKEWGAFHLINHGVPLQLLDEMRSVGLHFFNSPTDHKLPYACDPLSPASEGYGSRMLLKDDSVLDWRDYFDHHTLPISRRNPTRWPHYPPNYRSTVLDYSDSMKLLAQRLLAMVSETLGLPPTYIEESVGEVYQNITVSYYPPCPQPDLALGLQAHSDMGAITLLIQDDVGGLEVLKDGEWVLVRPVPGTIVVILADQAEIISNGEYKSAVHRALVNAQRARLSVATFYDPARIRRICPAPQLITECSPQRYREVVYGDYVKSWYSKGPEGKRNIDALLMIGEDQERAELRHLDLLAPPYLGLLL